MPADTHTCTMQQCKTSAQIKKSFLGYSRFELNGCNIAHHCHLPRIVAAIASKFEHNNNNNTKLFPLWIILTIFCIWIDEVKKMLWELFKWYGGSHKNIFYATLYVMCTKQPQWRKLMYNNDVYHIRTYNIILSTSVSKRFRNAVKHKTAEISAHRKPSTASIKDHP